MAAPMINFFIVFSPPWRPAPPLPAGGEPESPPQPPQMQKNGIMKPIFCLFDIFIPFLVRTSMLSSQPSLQSGTQGGDDGKFEKTRVPHWIAEEDVEAPSASFSPSRRSHKPLKLRTPGSKPGRTRLRWKIYSKPESAALLFKTPAKHRIYLSRTLI
ncbi:MULTISPECIES: hypothetical protein [Agrobacterium]|uniref:hypothetical protein n=1 Tax=Agrobacterium TaxID=357 RepID=UPI001E57ACBC|nr:MULTISPECIES: hypothetical protein [Agrobacterium]